MRKIVAVVLVLCVVLTAFTACKSSKKEAEEPISYSVDGTGNSSSKTLSVIIFGSEITLGKTTVQDLLDDGWGKDPEYWKDVDLEKEVEYKKDSISGKELDKRGIEIKVGFENITDAFAKYKDCTINSLSFEGLANFEACDFKVLDTVSIGSDVKAFEDSLKSSCTKYEYEKDTSFSSLDFLRYEVELDSGKISVRYSIDKESGEVSDASSDLDLNYDYSIK